MRCNIHGLLVTVVLLALTAGCTMTSSTNSQHDRLVSLLQREMRENSSWVRIHAADALLDHHATEFIADFFKDQAETAEPPYRIGVWRIMSRASTSGEQRQHWVERLRSVMLDAKASDRLSAAESLAKLGVSLPADSAAIGKWVAEADEATAPFPLWLLVLSSTGEKKAQHETRLATLLDSKDPVARLRAGFALGRLASISADSRTRLNRCAESEPEDSLARVYLLSAVLRQNQANPSLAAKIKVSLISGLQQRKPAEQLEAAITIGLCGTSADEAVLSELLNSTESDARIGAASGLLHLMR